MSSIVAEPKAGSITFRVKEFREKWCLYAHYLGTNNEIFYLGTCKLIDLYDFTDAYRNSHWRRTVNDDTIIRVEVLATADNPIDAQNGLRQMYNTYRPDANVHGYMQSGKTVVTCTEGDNAGKTYETAYECAKQNGITPGALSNHLNNRSGYDHVRGMKFKRGLP